MPYKKTSLISILSLIVLLVGCNKQSFSTEKNSAENPNTKISQTKNQISDSKKVVEKLEVYYFHRTARCVSCKAIGKYTSQTMEQKFSKQIADGLIDFRELNVELPENKEIAKKFQASGSSLFINRIIGGKDNIEQDVNVWRLLGNEEKFKQYLESKINSYLGIK